MDSHYIREGDAMATGNTLPPDALGFAGYSDGGRMHVLLPAPTSFEADAYPPWLRSAQDALEEQGAKVESGPLRISVFVPRMLRSGPSETLIYAYWISEALAQDGLGARDQPVDEFAVFNADPGQVPDGFIAVSVWNTGYDR